MLIEALSGSGQSDDTMPNITREKAEEIMCADGWLAHMPKPFRVKLLSHALLLKFAPGEIVYRYDDPVGGIYGLVAGALTINSAPPDASPRLVHLGMPGAWAGEGCFMTGQPRRAEIRALSEAWMMHVPLDVMEHMAAHDPRVVRAFGVISIFVVDVLIRIVHDLQKRDAGRRIASVLQRAGWLGDVPVPLTQADLGEMANASRQQVNAAMQRFSEAGWVKYTYRSVDIINPQALRRYAESDDSVSTG